MIGVSEPYNFAGKRVVVTGASSGIGAAFAERLAHLSADLVLVARSVSTLEETATTLRDRYGVSVEVVGADLADHDDRHELAERLAATKVDVLVNNAGIGSHGRFSSLPADRELAMVSLNVDAVVELARAVIPGMVERRSGGVLNVASTAGFQPTPSMATYGATKAFVISFSLALREECRRTGVRVLAFCPGPVRTNFGAATGDPGFASRFFAAAPGPDAVVPGALAAFAHGRAVHVPGLVNRIGALSPRFAPLSVAARAAGIALDARHGTSE